MHDCRHAHMHAHTHTHTCMHTHTHTCTGMHACAHTQYIMLWHKTSTAQCKLFRSQVGAFSTSVKNVFFVMKEILWIFSLHRFGPLFWSLLQPFWCWRSLTVCLICLARTVTSIVQLQDKHWNIICYRCIFVFSSTSDWDTFSLKNSMLSSSIHLHNKLDVEEAVRSNFSPTFWPVSPAALVAVVQQFAWA